MPNGNTRNNKTQKVKRVGFSNNKSFFGTAFQNKNLNLNLAKNLIKSRKSERPSPVRRNLALGKLNAKEAKLFANLSAASSNSQQMLENLQKIQYYLLVQSRPEFAEFAPSVQLNSTQRKLFQSLYAINSRVDKMENILNKIKNRILLTHE